MDISNETTRKKLGVNIMLLREKCDLPQEVLAILATVSNAAISKLENYKSNFFFDTVSAIVKVFGFTIEETVNLDIEKYSKEDLINRINAYRKTMQFSEGYNTRIKTALSKGDGPTKSVYKLIMDGYFDDYKYTYETVATIQEVFNQEFTSNQVSNILRNSSLLSRIKEGNKMKFIINKQGKEEQAKNIKKS